MVPLWLTGACLPPLCADAVHHALTYAPAPADNPLKGLVPYAGKGGNGFPHSMEFGYLPLSSIVRGPGKVDWTALEHLLEAIAGRGNQAVFRIYLEYPGKPLGVPEYLLTDGLKIHRYSSGFSEAPGKIETPDYQDPSLRTMLREFIHEFGKRYDGDPRIGYITAGLLGSWGEWHNYPRSDLFASPEVQVEVMDAYEAAFQITPVLLRYPAGEGNEEYAPNSKRSFGYHDDSFAWATLDTGRQQDDWFYQPLMKKAGPEAAAKWKTHPIGGEIRPEAWGVVFDKEPGKKKIQDFATCVDATHVTWLMDSGMFRKKQPAGRHGRAEVLVRRMGYEFHVKEVEFDQTVDGKLQISLALLNRGVAPLYYDWPAEFVLLDQDEKLSKPQRAQGNLSGLLPESSARVWNESLDTRGLHAGTYRVLLRVPNPLPTGKALRFANQSQSQDLPDYLTLGSVVLTGNE